MRLRHLAYFSLIFTAFVLLSACRNEPKLPVVAEDTEVNVRISGDPSGLNPLLNYDNVATQTMGLIFAPLMKYSSKTYELEPVLVKSLPKKEEVNSGDKKGLIAFTYEILEEAVWDDGTPITGNDFDFTIKAAYNPNYRSPYPSFFAFIEEVEVNGENPKQFTVYTKKYFLANAVLGTVNMMPSHRLDPNNIYADYSLADFKSKEMKEKLASDEQLKQAASLFTSPKMMGQDGALAGSGAYTLVNWEEGQSLRLERKENWWGDKINSQVIVANPKKITFKIVPDFNAARSLFRNGELDIMSSIGINDFQNLKEDAFFKENYNFYAPSIIAHRTVIMNNSDTRLSDKSVRKALAHLLDLEEIFDVVYLGVKNPVVSPIHPSKPYYRKDLQPIDFNIDKAKNLLKEAGWTDSDNNGILDKTIDGELKELDFKISFSGKFNDYRNIAQIFKEDAKQAGVNIRLTPLDSRPLQTGWKQKDFDLSFLPFIWQPLHKNLRQRWHSESSGNYVSFATVETDKIIDEIDQTVDEDKLAELYKRFQEIFYEEQPVIFINTASNHIMASKKFGNITTSAIPPIYYVNQLKQVTVPNFSNN